MSHLNKPHLKQATRNDQTAVVRIAAIQEKQIMALRKELAHHEAVIAAQEVAVMPDLA